jgi:hypothetical protein
MQALAAWAAAAAGLLPTVLDTAGRSETILLLLQERTPAVDRLSLVTEEPVLRR